MLGVGSYVSIRNFDVCAENKSPFFTLLVFFFVGGGTSCPGRKRTASAGAGVASYVSIFWGGISDAKATACRIRGLSGGGECVTGVDSTGNEGSPESEPTGENGRLGAWKKYGKSSVEPYRYT